MEISDYVTNCMSTEKTKDFLEMQNEQLSDFKPVLLMSDCYTFNDEGVIGRQTLEDMANKAVKLGCKYVANINLTLTVANQ